MGLFTPKWKSKDQEKRKHWVVKANHKNPKHKKILIELAKNDEVYFVRKTAYKKLEKEGSQEALADEAKNDKNKYSRMSAIEKLTDQDSIADIAKNEKDKDILSYAAQAVKKLTDQKILVDIVKNAEYWLIRSSAAKKLTDQNILVDIAKNDEDYFVREAAVEKLTDQKLLADIAKNDDEHMEVCKAAVEKLTNQKVLVDIVKNHKNRFFCIAIISKLTDQKVLVDIAKNAEQWAVRKIAINKITDQKVLVDIAKNDMVWDVSMLRCDICGTPLSESELIIVSPHTVAEATNKGYIPQELSDTFYVQSKDSGVSDKAYWKTVVNSNLSFDWGLCDICMDYLNFWCERIELSHSDNSGTFTDSRDGNVYKTIKIGNQVWMAENLNYDAGEGCVDFDTDTGYNEKNGKHYYWETAKKIAPKGWHLPTKAEFETLLNNLGTAYPYHTLIEGGISGFSASEDRWHSGRMIGDYKSFWSSSKEDSARVWILSLTTNNVSLLGFTCNYPCCVRSFRIMKKVMILRLNN